MQYGTWEDSDSSNSWYKGWNTSSTSFTMRGGEELNLSLTIAGVRQAVES